MATGPGRGDVPAITDPELWREQQRFFNFLQHYDLHKYHQRFLRMGVRRISHFKDVSDADLDAVGLTPPEKTRLRKKLDENFSTTGKFKKAIVRKGKLFDVGTIPEETQHHRPPLDPATQGASLIAKEDIKLEKKIGEGAHGTVFEGTWSNMHGSVVVAVKTLYGKDEVQSTFIKEADSMRALLHEHIIQLYGIVLSSPLMLIQELAPCGDLHTFLVKHGATKNAGLFHTYATQIADAMKYLEEKRIVHRDLAARNILLSAEDYLKLSDFGMARILDEQTGIYNLSNLQSRIPIAWTSLEALIHAKFSTASDVWSFAVTLWEIYSLGDIPWKGLTPIEIRDYLVSGERLGCPERCPREMYHVMNTCWESRPQDRPTFASLYQILQRSSPEKVRALESHAVAADEDNNCLSFEKGDLIFLIDKPKQGWMYGMLMDGKIGYFLEDHVTAIIDPIGSIKEKLQAGKAKVTDLPISKPTQFSHELHWGKNGEKWGKTEEELISNQPAISGNRSPKSPPFRVVNSSPSPSHVSKHRPPDSALGDSADARYTPHSSRSPTLSSSEVGSPTDRVSPSGDRGVQENNQYVTMRKMSTDTEQEDYVDMNPNPTGLMPTHTYENVHRMGANLHEMSEDVFYSVPRSREVLPSDSSSSDGDSSRPGSRDKSSRFKLPPRGLAINPTDAELQLSKLRTRTLSPGSTSGVPSQYSLVSPEILTDPAGALSPTKVRILQTALPPLTSSITTSPESSRKCHASLGDIRQETEKEEASSPSIVRPRPKPRGNAAHVKRSASVALPDVHEKFRKSSLQESSPDLLTKAAKNISLFTPHQKKTHIPEAQESDDTEPLIPIEAPPVPDRTYLSSTNHEDQNACSAPNSPAHNRFENPLVAEFPDTAPELCQRALETHGFNVSKAREEVQVQILLGMHVPNTNADDCRRALKHCQWKIDRAASWLVERSIELEDKRT